jgi:hypothetical protein
MVAATASCSHLGNGKVKIDTDGIKSHALSTKRHTASSSASGHGNDPLVKISTQQIANA